MLAFALIATLVGSHVVPSITVSWPKAMLGQYSGRIVVFVSRSSSPEPRLGPNWRDPLPIVSFVVKQAKPDVDNPIDDAAATRLANLSPGSYTLQAVLDRNPASPRVGDGDGNMYSLPVEAKFDATSSAVRLVCDQVIDEPTVLPTATVKLVEMESAPVSDAQRRSFIWRAAVVLPSEFATDPSHRLPIILDIPDRSDSYANYPGRGTNQAAYRDGKPFIYVRLDPESSTGYHYLVDSDVNGPVAKALVEEFLPYVAKQYRGDMSRVLVTGAGAGGWSAIWLQLTYPSAFIGAWAKNPESLDFHNFHGLNLYVSTNAFQTAAGVPTAWARGGAETWRTHAEVENVLRGLTIGGWESDFSPKAKNGRAVPLFDRVTGNLDPSAAKHWELYDVTAMVGKLVLSQVEKLHISGVRGDSEFRDDGVDAFQAALGALGLKADVRLTPDALDTNAAQLQVAHAEAVAAYLKR